MSKDSVGKVLIVATSLCVVCSLLVTTAALALRDRQEENAVREVKRNILLAAGLLEDDGKGDLEELFGKMKARVIDLATGEEVSGVDPATFDPAEAVKDSARRAEVPADWIGRVGIREHSRLQKVYVKEAADGSIDTLVLPIHGKGLWSTMYAFLAIDGDLRTAEKLIYYKHGETPGLGAEVDNPFWKRQWQGKQLFDAEGKYEFQILKGKVEANDPKKDHKADGLTGATITTKGVDGTLAYWMGEHGYGPFLSKLRAQR